MPRGFPVVGTLGNDQRNIGIAVRPTLAPCARAIKDRVLYPKLFGICARKARTAPSVSGSRTFIKIFWA